MEGDAGASRLNPKDTDDSSSSEVTTEDSAQSEVGADQTTPEVTTEDSAQSEVGADQTTPEVTTEDSAQSEVGADQTTPEVTTEELDEAAQSNAEELSASGEGEAESANDERGPSRLGRGWFVGITAALLALAVGVGAGGYLALRSHQGSQAIARHDAAALVAAKDCVAATQAPDTNAMAASAQKMIDCGSGAYRSQAILYSGLLVEAYQAANAHVQVSDLRAAVERNNADGSIVVLVPMRVAMSNIAAQNQETGYRLRVTMVLDEGQYRITKLDQVAK
jgi:Mce-associated membrane protein